MQDGKTWMKSYINAMNKTDEINHDELCARQIIIKQSSEVTSYRGTVAINDFGRHRWHPPIHLGGTFGLVR